eukprot:6450587-Heterocapsa_arctica.AAC.1
MACVKATPQGGLKRKTDGDSDGHRGQSYKHHAQHTPSRGGSSSSTPQMGGQMWSAQWQQGAACASHQPYQQQPSWTMGASMQQPPQQWDHS